jgi:hypothetical protein
MFGNVTALVGWNYTGEIQEQKHAAHMLQACGLGFSHTALVKSSPEVCPLRAVPILTFTAHSVASLSYQGRLSCKRRPGVQRLPEIEDTPRPQGKSMHLSHRMYLLTSLRESTSHKIVNLIF